jgi:hypothetical protein
MNNNNSIRNHEGRKYLGTPRHIVYVRLTTKFVVKKGDLYTYI